MTAADQRVPASDTDDLLDRVEEQTAVDRAGDGSPSVEVPLAEGEQSETVSLPSPDQPTWRQDYPYETKMTEKEYQAAKRSLQIELLKMQGWVKATRAKVACVFEGRDAAGKGGTIKRFTEHLNPRGARVVAL